MGLKLAKFKCLDNTGVQLVKCIHLYKLRVVQPCSIILITIKKVLPHRKLTKGQVFKAVVVRLLKKTQRISGITVCYNQNSVVLLKKNELIPIGTRIYGSVFFENRIYGFMKIVTLSSFLL